MKENEFYDLVLQMRNAQKEYFRTRSKSVLECSKELERKVDAAIGEHEQPQLTFEQECAEGRFGFDPNRSFEQRCEIVRRTAVTPEMTYEERLAAQKRRFGL